MILTGMDVAGIVTFVCGSFIASLAAIDWWDGGWETRVHLSLFSFSSACFIIACWNWGLLG